MTVYTKVSSAQEMSRRNSGKSSKKYLSAWACLTNIEGSVWLIVAQASSMDVYTIWICHPGLLYHYRVSFVPGVLHPSGLLPSFPPLCAQPEQHVRDVFGITFIGLFWFHIGLRWHLLPSVVVFFILLATHQPIPVINLEFWLCIEFFFGYWLIW